MRDWRSWSRASICSRILGASASSLLVSALVWTGGGRPAECERQLTLLILQTCRGFARYPQEGASCRGQSLLVASRARQKSERGG